MVSSSNGYWNEKRVAFHPVVTQERIIDIYEMIGWF